MKYNHGLGMMEIQCLLFLIRNNPRKPMSESAPKRVVLHIGAHKTGSSSIQASLLNLDTPSHRYISFTSDGNESGPFLTAFSDDPSQIWTNRYKGLSKQQVLGRKSEILAFYDSALAQSKAYNVVFSGEAISKFPVSSLKRLKAFFEARCCDVELFIYMRPLYSVIPSNFQQFLTAPPNIWVNDLRLYEFPNLRRLAKKCLPGYPNISQNLLQVFSRSAVHFLPFSKDAFPKGDVVLDFINRINIDDYYAKKIVRVNEACSALATKILWLEGLGSSWADKSISFPERRSMVNHLKLEFSLSPGMIFSPSIVNQLVSEIEPLYSSVNKLIEIPAYDAGFDLCTVSTDADLKSRYCVAAFSDLTRFSNEENDILARYAEKYGRKLNAKASPIEIAQAVTRIAYSQS